MCFGFFLFTNRGESYVLMFKTGNANYTDSFDNVICKTVESRGDSRFLFCNGERGVFFSERNPVQSDLKDVLNAFIVEGQTKLKKEPNSDWVLFITGVDTLEIVYRVGQGGTLISGEIFD